jgi:1-acyl-sn-glycerol-3-phosphate acyltransferase
MKPAHVPLWRRLERLIRLCAHIVRGLLIAGLRFPRLSQEAREAEKLRWSKRLLAILSISVSESGGMARLPARCMLVLNHISWLDIFVIDARFPATFVAKSEIRDWPVVGWLCTLVGTIYIERGKRAAARSARETLAQALAGGTLIAICPEGTTTHGDRLEPFHSALFQPAIDAQATIQPLALRYLDTAGRRSDAAGYVGDDSLLQSVWAIVSAPRLVVELTFPHAIAAAGETRRTLADRTAVAIARALDVPVPARHTEPEREPGPRAARH